MKNIKYFPFERNRYFYGKLLTVDDFQTEQKYMNDKRRLINRFLHGSGVVCGLNVIQADDYSISLEAGMALDFSGREIVVDVPVLKKLSMIEGFDAVRSENEDNGYLYLCIEYAEEEKNPVFNVAGSTSDTEFGRIGENYRLYLTDREPTDCNFNNGLCYEECKSLFWDKGVRISQVIPKYVRSGEEFMLRVVVENLGQKQAIRFSYDLELEGMYYGKDQKLTVSFDEEKFKKSHRYELVFPLKAVEGKNRQGMIKLVPESFLFSTGAYRQDAAKPEYVSYVTITDKEIGQVLREKYHQEAMEEIIKDTYHQSIYLAKIRIIYAGETYVIDTVEQMPFQQYVYNGALSFVTDHVMDERVGRLERLFAGKDTGEKLPDGCGTQDPMGNKPPQVSSGSVTFLLGVGGASGKRFYSEEITHGLGLGNVRIILGEECGCKDGAHILYGDGGIFDEEINPVKIQMAARVDVTKGTFVIGMKLLEATLAKKVKIHWMAVRDENEDDDSKKEQRLFIKPDTRYLNLRESCYFEPVFAGVSDRRVHWKVKDDGGGIIDENGKYTAPDMPGIYEIIAESVAFAQLKASAFVVVRDPDTR